MSDQSDFFVGYLPTPRRLSRFLMRLCIVGVVAVVIFGAIIAANQKDPGSARWDLDHEQTLEGVLYASPYPMLLVHSDGADQLVLLVTQGKVGAASGDVTKLDGRRIRTSGFILQRQSRVLLELSGPPTPISDQQSQPLVFSAEVPITLRGELIDPKCYSGAMKPGEGKTHKACAALCLRGGIPPMLVTRDGARTEFHLLADENGGALEGDVLDEVVAVAGELVEVTGQRCEAPGISLVKVSAGSLRRLRP
jgi:hypothetical protein